MPLCQLFMMSLYIKSETTSTHMSHICLIYVSYRLLLCFLCSFRLSLPCWYCQRWHCRIGSIFVPRSSGTCASPSWRPCINALIRNHVNPRESKGTSTDSNWSKTKSYWQIFTNFHNIQTQKWCDANASLAKITKIWRFAQQRQPGAPPFAQQCSPSGRSVTHSVLQCNGNDVLIVLFYCF